MNNSSLRPQPTGVPIGAVPPQPPPEPSPRERIARAKTLVRRGFGYWKTAFLVFLIGCAGAAFYVMNVKRQYRAEAVLEVKPGVRVGNDDGGDREGKTSARLKDMLLSRSRLESAIKKFGLYGKAVEAKPIHEVAEDMKPHVGFRALDSGRYIISFDGENQDEVQKVTEFLAQSLIDDYTGGNIDTLQRDAKFLEEEEKKKGLELAMAQKGLIEFLAKHPAFATEAKQAQTPFGPSPALTGGIPLLPNLNPKDPKNPAGTTPRVEPMDPELAALFRNDGRLGDLYRQRAKLEEEAKANTPQQPTPQPVNSAAQQQRQAQIEAAQAEVDAAMKNVSEKQADLANKRTQLTEEHPDVKSARAQADQAARQLQTATAKLAALKAAPQGGSVPNPYDAPANAELVAKIQAINAQIGAREAELRKQKQAGGGVPTPAPTTTTPGAPTQTASVKPPDPTNPVVALEMEWQSLLKALGQAKSAYDAIAVSSEKARLAAAGVKANQGMSIIENAKRPSKPFKGGRAQAAMIGAAAAIFLTLLYMATRVAFNDTIIDAADVEALKLIPVLGVVPRLNLTQPNNNAKDTPAPAKGDTASAV